MKHPFVSVIVPNYNHAPFLKERLDSIINQSYNYLEIIILDDNSSDNSCNIIKQYKGHPLVSHIIINEINNGSPFVQWKKGFSLAKGELVWIAESDDYCDPDYLKTLVRQFEFDEKCVLAFCKSQIVDVDGNIINDDSLINGDLIIDGRRFIKDYLSRYNFIINASSALFSKKTLYNMENNYTQFRGCGDWVFWIEIAKNGDVSYVDTPLNKFRQHGTNTTIQQIKSMKGFYEVIDVMNYMRENRYISKFQYLRAQLINVYSVKYGKSSMLFSKDQMLNIQKKWEIGIITQMIVYLLYILQRFGIHLINR